MPEWRWVQESKLTDPAGLKVVANFEQPLDPNLRETSVELPSNLGKGIYLLQTSWGDTDVETFIQLTDLSYFQFNDDEQQYYWFNDLKRDQSAAGTVMGDLTADDQGMIISPLQSSETFTYHIAEHKGEKLFFYTYARYQDGDITSDYWKYIKTDRPLYKPDDEVAYFGFLQHREDGTFPETVRVEINEQRWFYDWFWFGDTQEVPLVKEEVTLENGFYEGSLDLPSLAEGSYELNVMDGDQVLSSSYVRVENYVKPDYKLSVSKEKEAIFVDETLRFGIEAAFFEGTPLPGLAMNYDIHGFSYDSGLVTGDDKGKAEVIYEPGSPAGYQGYQYGGISVYATMPESGEIYAYDEIRIFINDIDVSLETDLDGDQGTLEVVVNTITLDRLNDGTAEDFMDFLDKPLEGQIIEGMIYRNRWVKEARGQYYDFINKEVRTQYDYRTETEPYMPVSLTTDEMGKATASVTLPEEKDVYYHIEITTNDTQGRPMSYERSFRDYDPWLVYENYLQLKGDKELYHEGDDMSLSLISGGEPAVGEEFLYVFGSNGIKEVIHGTEPEILREFTKDFVPGVQVNAVCSMVEATRLQISSLPKWTRRL